ncbi:DUF2868 domain-containing protein [Oxalobacteraceae bacterium OM1]|nr:DUF2868 domain-containing protein [Oxalobacteraceae bacterium OM1]
MTRSRRSTKRRAYNGPAPPPRFLAMDKPDRLRQMIMTHAVRLAEESGPLEDATETRAAVLAEPDTCGQIMVRAWRLGVRLKYVPALERVHAMLPAAGAALMFVVALVGLSIARSITEDRYVNIMVAIVGMLGTNFVMFAVWLAGVAVMLFKRSQPGAQLGGFSLGHAMLALSGRLAGGRASGALVRSAFSVMQRAKLAPWAFGLVSHVMWASAFVIALLALGFAFSFRAYRIGWETTILPPDFFTAFVHASGVIPGWFGFPIPDVAHVGASALEADQRDWAWWLMGLLTVYGLVPRVAGAVVCWLLWRRGQSRLQLDLADPYYARLAERVRTVQAHVTQEAGGPAGAEIAHAGTAAMALIEFELPSNEPMGIVTPVANGVAHKIAGTVEERRTTLERLGAIRPRRLLIAVDACATPDRGTERFLREAFSYAERGAVLLAIGEDGEAEAADRWRRWLSGSTLAAIACLADAAAAQSWLEGADA